MFQSALKSGRRRIALLTALTALMVGFGASSAFASSIAIAPAGPYEWTQKVKVSGEASAGATHVGLVACNVSEAPALWGTRCDVNSATPGLVPVANYEGGGIEITIRRGPWADWSFVTGAPVKGTGFTTCFSEELVAGDACAVIASYYEVVGKETNRLGADAALIPFE